MTTVSRIYIGIHGNETKYLFSNSETKYSPEELLAMILEKAKEAAEDFAGWWAETTNCLVTFLKYSCLGQEFCE